VGQRLQQPRHRKAWPPLLLLLLYSGALGWFLLGQHLLLLRLLLLLLWLDCRGHRCFLLCLLYLQTRRCLSYCC
jgi:hypothetical protein